MSRTLLFACTLLAAPVAVQAQVAPMNPAQTAPTTPLQLSLADAVSRGLTSVFLDSRLEVIEFYKRRGYEPHLARLMHKDSLRTK